MLVLDQPYFYAFAWPLHLCSIFDQVLQMFHVRCHLFISLSLHIPRLPSLTRRPSFITLPSLATLPLQREGGPWRRRCISNGGGSELRWRRRTKLWWTPSWAYAIFLATYAKSTSILVGLVRSFLIFYRLFNERQEYWFPVRNNNIVVYLIIHFTLLLYYFNQFWWIK